MGKFVNSKPSLCIVIPCYNEEDVLPVTAPLFRDKIDDLIRRDLVDKKSRVLFVDDGSSDSTWDIIKKLSEQDKCFIGISQSRNRGHQNALVAGLMTAKDSFDIMISIDCDGQDDINAMDEMVKEYLKGNDIVYGVRSSRKTDTFFKRFTAESFYKFLKFMGAEVVFNHADYRLVSSRVMNEFEKYKEVNLFLRGLFPLIGFNSSQVYYERNERIAGDSHYPLKKMLGLAFDGITSLCVRPLRFIAGIGVFFIIVGLVGTVWSIIARAVGKETADWTIITFVVALFSGINLSCLGIVGEYIGKIYFETKQRPKYIIKDKTFDEIGE